MLLDAVAAGRSSPGPALADQEQSARTTSIGSGQGPEELRALAEKRERFRQRAADKRALLNRTGKGPRGPNRKKR